MANLATPELQKVLCCKNLTYIPFNIYSPLDIPQTNTKNYIDNLTEKNPLEIARRKIKHSTCMRLYEGEPI
jgi:hypothetical protein